MAVEIGGEAKAYPFGTLADRAPTAIHDVVGGADIVVFSTLGTSGALDTGEIAEGRDVGAGVFRAVEDGRQLTLEPRDGGFVDLDTGSRWNLLGEAIAGSLEGRGLEPVVHIDTLWFAWGAFEPDTIIWQP